MQSRISKIINREQRKLEDYLDRSGLKFTAGRQAVLREVLDAHGHFTAEDLVKRCQKQKRDVSRATIYRSLNELLEAGIVRKTAFGEKHQNFEHLYDETKHHHARCIRCLQIVEFPDLEEDTVYRPILEKKGFKVLGHEMHFYGICNQCQ